MAVRNVPLVRFLIEETSASVAALRGPFMEASETVDESLGVSLFHVAAIAHELFPIESNRLAICQILAGRAELKAQIDLQTPVRGFLYALYLMSAHSL